MCLMLYLASDVALMPRRSDDVHLDQVTVAHGAVRQWLALPEMFEVGAHTGCGCGFPHVIADEPVEWFDEMFDEEAEDRPKDLASVRALFALIDEALVQSASVELFPAWDGDEGEEPLGIVEWQRSALTPETFVVTERFLYRITP